MNAYNNAVFGLGKVGQYEDEPWLGSGGSTTTAYQKKTLSDTIREWLGIAKEGADIFNTVKNQNGSVTYVMPNTPHQHRINAKYILIGGGAFIAIGAVAWLTRSGNKKSLGQVGSVKAKRSKKRKNNFHFCRTINAPFGVQWMICGA